MTTLKIRPRAAGTINAAPVITASDRTITVGDAFDPLDGVTAHDAEDGDMPLAAANVAADDVDPDTPGTYHVTITVTDSQGATTSKTFTVVVQAKEGGETPELSLIPRRARAHAGTCTQAGTRRGDGSSSPPEAG